MPLEKYAAWLRSSWCHVYLTEPYVASWSLNEAISSGIKIVATNHESVIEFTKSIKNVKLVNHNCEEALLEAINSQLRTADKVFYDTIEIGTCAEKSLAHLVRLVAGDEANTTV